MSTQAKTRWIAIVTVILLAGTAGFLLSRVGFKQPAQDVAKSSGQIHDCQPGPQLCRAAVGQRTISVKLPQTLRYLKKFPLHVILEGFVTEQVVEVTAEFSMREMEMGINRFRLASATAGQWSTDAVLPICVSGRHDWVVSITVQTERNFYMENFAFEVKS